MRFLIDVDGVVADLFNALMDKVRQKHGDAVHLEYEDAKEFYFFDNLPEDQKATAQRVLAEPSFAKHLQLMPGAKEAIEKIRDAGHEIFWVTSPLNASITWVYDRNKWLEENLDVDPYDIIYAHKKFVVSGDILIDDKTENVRLWLEQNPKGLALLYAHPWNERDVEFNRFTWSGIDVLLENIENDN